LFLLRRWDLENYWSLLLLPSVGQVTGWWAEILLVLLLLLRHSVSGEHRMVGYLWRHSDAQVSKAGGQLSGKWTVINDIYIILMAYLVGFAYRSGYRLGLYYLILNDRLTSLTLVWALTVIVVGRRPSSPWSRSSRPSLLRSQSSKPSLGHSGESWSGDQGSASPVQFLF